MSRRPRDPVAGAASIRLTLRITPSEAARLDAAVASIPGATRSGLLVALLAAELDALDAGRGTVADLARLAAGREAPRAPEQRPEPPAGPTRGRKAPEPPAADWLAELGIRR